MQKIVSKLLKCGTTGEWYTAHTLVTIPDPYAAVREKNETVTTAQAEKEANAINRHRQVRPDVQKIGWMR